MLYNVSRVGDSINFISGSVVACTTLSMLLGNITNFKELSCSTKEFFFNQEKQGGYFHERKEYVLI